MTAIGPRRVALLAVLVAVVGHEVVLGIGYGAGAELSSALRATEHGLGWLLTVATLALAGAAAVAVLAIRIGWLRRRLAAGPALPWLPAGRARVLRSTWHRLFAAAIVIFLLQENAEHLIVHGHAPLLEPLLAGQYVATVPVFAGLSLLVAAAAITLIGRLEQLTIAVHAQRAPLRGATSVVRPRSRLVDARQAARQSIGPVIRRAPPVLA